MAGHPLNERQNADGTGNVGTPIGSEDFDAIGAALGGVSGAVLMLAVGLGHEVAAVWFGFVTAFFAVAALVWHAHEKRWRPRVVTKHPWWWTIVAAIVAVAGSVVGVGLLPDSKLVPGHGGTPARPAMPNDLAHRIPDDPTYLFLGPCVGVAGEFPFALINQREEAMLIVGKNDDELLLSAKVFNREGKVLCEIVENEFTINTNNVFRFDHDSPNKLSVVDDELRPVIEVEYINDEAIRIFGEYFLREGVRMTVTRKRLTFAPETTGDRRELAIIKPMVFIEEGQGRGISFDFPADPAAAPFMELVSGNLSEECLHVIGGTRKATPEERAWLDKVKKIESRLVP